MATVENPELQLAYNFVQYTNKNVFLTGRAGTGKTTFLLNLKKQLPKRMVVVAPTGVAAINAGGVTIHSFFQMPFGPQIPESNIENRTLKGGFAPSYLKISRDKINIIKSLDLLVIDEISMVRADLLDGIDQVLRRFKDKNKPFGGVQLLMIGDLQQLAPVIKDDEWNILKEYYDTVFFFSSRALQKTNFISIELKQIYRQSDSVFINILNKIREDKLDIEALEVLNKRYLPNFDTKKNEGYITLTTHNATAHEINDNRLKDIKEPEFTFKATIQGDFPKYSYPTEFELRLKKGSQVMFVKNDSSKEKLFFNGKIGTITDIDDDVIYVKCTDNYSPIAVTTAEWQNMKYSLNEQTKEIEETVIGSFVQYPLKLAWAITIHKSQGLTFEKAIIDANASFAHGQVYVALSRCKSLEGLVLSKPFSQKGIISNTIVSQFVNTIEQNHPDETQLQQAKTSYQHSLLSELFDFSGIHKRLKQFLYLLNENKASIIDDITGSMNQIEQLIIKEINSVSDKFTIQLSNLLLSNPDIDNNVHIQERINKACIYFDDKLRTVILSPTKDIEILSDNKTVKKTLLESLKNLIVEMEVKLACLDAAKNGFNIKSYLEAKAKASISNIDKTLPSKESKAKPGRGSKHNEVFYKLKEWRDSKADEMGLPEYMVLPQKTLIALSTELPSTLKELKAIKGMGNKRATTIGNEILQIILSYRKENNLSITIDENVQTEEEKPTKKNTKLLTFELLKSGLTIEEIAKERKMATSTIEGHLAHFIGTGELSIAEFVDNSKVKLISDYFSSSGNTSLNQAKDALGETISYADLKYVLKHLEYLEHSAQ